MNLLGVLEGILFVVGDEGVTLTQICDILSVDMEEAKRLLMELKKSYDEDFKKMIVELYENKKPVVEIKREYGIAEATLYRWIKEYGKIKVANNETTTNHEIKRLKKELAQAKEENEILKKAVAIFTQK